MLDLNALQTFVLAAEELNFTSVAARRNTVQSAVSAQIRKLEASVGRQLFNRGRGEVMRLTAEGEAFLVYARRLLSLSEEAVETVRTSGSRRIIRLGTTVTLAMSVVCDVLRAFAARRPDIQIQIQCERSDALLKRLDDGEMDIAFMMDQGRHATRVFVHSQSLVWVCVTWDPILDHPAGEFPGGVTWDPILDHPAGEFPGGDTHGGPDAPEVFMSDIGGLLPMAL